MPATFKEKMNEQDAVQKIARMGKGQRVEWVDKMDGENVGVPGS